MGPQAGVQLSPRKVQVAAQGPQLCESVRFGAVDRALFRLIERRQRVVVAVEDAQAGRKPDQRPDSLVPGRGHVDAAAEGRNRILGATLRQVNVAEQRARAEAFLAVAGQFQCTLGVDERATESMGALLHRRRAQLCRGGQRVVSSREVIRVQPAVPTLVPARGVPVQFTARRAQQGLVDRRADQRVREAAFLALVHEQAGRLEPRAVQFRVAEHVAQRRRAEPDPERRRRVQHTLQVRLQALDPGQQQCAYRSRQRRLPGARGAQQLLEKQRMPGRGLQATLDDLDGQVGEARGELAGLVVRERREVEHRDRAAARARAPRGADRVVVAACRQGEQHRQGRDCRGEVAELADLPRVGPVHVLDDDHLWTQGGGVCNEAVQHACAIALAQRIAHRREQRGGLGGRSDAQQVERRQFIARWQRAGGDGSRDRLASLSVVGIDRDTQQLRGKCRGRPVARGLAEVERLHAAHLDAVDACGLRERLEQHRLADAGVAAHDDGPAASCLDHAIEQRQHHRQFGPATGESLRRADARRSCGAPETRRLPAGAPSATAASS